MGIDLQLYRCRIGVFSGGHGTKNVTVMCDQNAILDVMYSIMSMCAVWFIGTLLIMSGIEQNPGPPGTMDMNDPKFKNWVTAAYGLKYLKSGLLSFVFNQVELRHAELKQEVAQQYPNVQSCSVCTSKNLLPDHGSSNVCNQRNQRNCFCFDASDTRRKCPNNFCSYFYDLIVNDHVEKNPRWSNTNPGKWYNDCFQYAKCFLGTQSSAKSMKEVDGAGLLNIVIHNCHIHQSVDDVNLFKQCRGDRNNIFHSGNYDVTDQKRTKYIDDMIRVLEDRNCLINDQQAKEMVKGLKKLKTGQIYITEVDIVGLVQDSIAAIKELADEVKQDIEKQRKQYQEDFENRHADAIHEFEKKKNEALDAIDEKAATYFKTSSESIKQDLIQIYQRDCSLLPVSPLLENECEHLLDVYQYPSMYHVDYHKDQTNKIDEQVTSFEDIFCSDGRLYHNIYITGDTGVGKTSLSKYMCLLWCQSICGPKIDSKRVLNDIDFMKKIDYVFYVTLRDTERIDVIAMIVDQLFFGQSDSRWEKMYDCIENIIRQHNCLLIMDGFDEWHPKSINKKDYLFPTIIPSEKCISLTTCRPYKIENVRLSRQDIDHQVKMTGIHGDSSKLFIKIVVNYLNKENSCDKNPDDFLHEIEKCGLEDQLHIPIIASHLVVIWFNQNISDMSRALIYGHILDMLFERARKRKLIFPSRKTSEFQLPVVFTKLKYLTENVSYLHKVCFLAFRSLFKQDENVSTLVFTSEQLMSEPYILSDEDINFLCQIGILSKNKIIGCFLEQKQKMSFLHKSYIEFLAVLFVYSFDTDKSFDNIVKQWTSINDFVQFENFFLLLAGFSYQKIKFLLENIYKTISDDLTSCKRNAIFLDSKWSYTRQIKSVQTIVINCYKEVSRYNRTHIELKLEDFIFDSSSDVNILKKLLSLNKECVQYIHSNDGLYHDEFDQVEGLQCLHISSKMPCVKFSDCMLQNSSTLHSVSIRKCTLGSELPVRSLQHLTSLSLSLVKMQHNSLHNIVKVLSDNVCIENIKLSRVSCDNNQREDRDCTLTLNLPHHTKLTSLCLENVDIVCNNVNNSSLQSLRLCSLGVIARRYYIDIFNCVKDSQLEHLYINGNFELDRNTLQALTSTVKTLPNIKSLELQCMKLPEDVLLQLHPNVTPVKVVLLRVIMSGQCFHSFIESLVNKQSVIKVQLGDLTLTSLEELCNRNTMQYISEWLTSKHPVSCTILQKANMTNILPEASPMWEAGGDDK